MEKTDSNKMNRKSVIRILLAIFCIIIGACVAFVMFGIYNPSQNALKALSSVSMDVVCIVILLILVSSFVFDRLGINKTTRLYAALLVATVWAVFLDFLNWAFDGSLEFGHLTFWFTVGSLCMGAVLAGVFSLYLYSYMEETHKLDKMRLSALICAILNFVSFVVTFILAITGTAFSFVDGHYEIGALYDVVTVVPILSLLYLTGYVFCHVKRVGLHDALSVAGYILFMIAGALIEASYSIGTTYVAVAIADIFIFVMLQNEIIAKEKRNVLEWMKKSNTDELTGVFNRHAYETDVAILEASTISDDFVYVSVDVNSLKIVNDSLGHNAGDELIIGAAECLNKCFGPYGKLYRTGGDEFIALIFVEEEKLKDIQQELDELIAAWKGKTVQNITLSCGYVTRSEAQNMSVKQMGILADHRMYDAKNEYYRSTGTDRRKK